MPTLRQDYAATRDNFLMIRHVFETRDTALSIGSSLAENCRAKVSASKKLCFFSTDNENPGFPENRSGNGLITILARILVADHFSADLESSSPLTMTYYI